MNHIFPQCIAILTAIFLLAAPALPNNVTDHREQLTGHVSPGTGVNSPIGKQGQAVVNGELISYPNATMSTPTVEMKAVAAVRISAANNTPAAPASISTKEGSNLSYKNTTVPDADISFTTPIPRTTAPVPRIETIARNNSGIPGAVPQVQIKSSSQHLLAGDVNTVTYLNKFNALGLPENGHWDIFSPGTYILDISLSTNHPYAVWIHSSDVIFDGNGQTITGPGMGSEQDGPSYYGVRVNSGALTQNITVKNVIVKNKSFGVIYEDVEVGEISSSQFASNNIGIYTSKCSNLNILSNTVNSNNHGIMLAADQSTNNYFTIDSNNVYSNALWGIFLSQSNNYNVIRNNQVNNNDMGIVLEASTAPGTDNTISSNTVDGNVIGMFVSNYHDNHIIGNRLYGNSNRAVWMLGASSNNEFKDNDVRDSGWLGMYLSGSSTGNFFYNNNFSNIDNEDSDGTVSNNQWYTTPTPGVNIVGGPSIGGNYWSNPSKNGFSDTHRDNNNDGFCDQQYYHQNYMTHQDDIIDKYPLAGDMNTVTHLDASNVLGSPGSEYWDIIHPGTYILDISLNTNNPYAVLIHSSDVIFDGNGQTITGPGIGSGVETAPSCYGIRVNTGTQSQNVTVKNVIVENKHFGVIYEGVNGGEIRDSNFTLNGTGIYTWNSSNLNILSNTVNSNNDGIVLDADQSTNDYFTIHSNNVYANGTHGIMLWLSNNHNTITNNQVNDNNIGISLTDGETGVGGTDNTLSYNIVNGNVIGMFVSNYHDNHMIGNRLYKNSNRAVWILRASSNNEFKDNDVRDSGWLGMYLSDSSNGNFFYNNNFSNIDNEDSDGTTSNNQWYITPTPGVNIVGGPSIGGNYWSNPSSTGFSDTQPDSNNDGFCDQEYHHQDYITHQVDIIDKYPLHKIAVFNVTPASINFGYVPVGSMKDQLLTVKNTGSGTLSGNATTAAPFSIVSGGSYSLGADQSQVVTIRYQPTSPGTHTGAVVFTGGSGAAVPVTGKTSNGKTSSGMPWLMLLLGE